MPKKCLMIVAHPDDESLFGGQELLDGNEWHVVCLTNAQKVARVQGFRAAMQYAGATCEIWDYPDRPGLSRDAPNARLSWQPFMDEMKARLKGIADLIQFGQIVTHNPEGEYGHEHHKLTHELVREALPDVSLHVFSIGSRAISRRLLERKLVLLDLYGDQIAPIEREQYKSWILSATTRVIHPEAAGGATP